MPSPGKTNITEITQQRPSIFMFSGMPRAIAFTFGYPSVWLYVGRKMETFPQSSVLSSELTNFQQELSGEGS